ncbi:glycerophosphodiester phosphodiesterase [Dermatobacter hominis]|uniref:glycerophosphodiester phosphodiesterase n=1 Tax=Dermatobacter hominis TaxID=2884263 RepID=UPI001D12F0EE|nr:glycerophosphodiester phosphodiesterase [Dermatobacter hominis]UDY36384.1 glycerophosphodiester phosphodiesterase [Dermatobacter hominis]
MADRLPSLRVPPILFAHRGARAHAPENTIEAFTLALRLGATGIESDVWRTADGAAVLDHDGLLRKGLRRIPIREVARADLPASIPTLAELYEACGTDVELSLDVKDPDVLDEVLRTARTAGATERLWLCHPDLDLLSSWRDASGAVRLVHSTRLGAIGKPEPHAAHLRERRVDAVNLHQSEWTGGMVALYHRFHRLTLGWDAQHERVIRALLSTGIDGVFSDHVDRMVDVAGEGGPGDADEATEPLAGSD